MANQKGFYIGIDLNDDWTQIGYYTEGMQEPETVSLPRGSGQDGRMWPIWTGSLAGVSGESRSCWGPRNMRRQSFCHSI